MLKDNGAFFESNNKHRHICVAYRCGNKRVGKSRFCSKHRHRYRKYSDIVSYTFYLLKGNAKRRGKEFSITLDYFREWCKETGYIQKKGRNKMSMTIDRIDPNKGYVKGNLQMITNRDNVVKMHNQKDYSKAFSYGCPF